MNRIQSIILSTCLMIVPATIVASDGWHHSDVELRKFRLDLEAKGFMRPNEVPPTQDTAINPLPGAQSLATAILNTFYGDDASFGMKAQRLANTIRGGGPEAGAVYAEIMQDIGDTGRIQLQGFFQDQASYLGGGFSEADAARFRWAIDGADSIINGNRDFEMAPIVDERGLADSEAILAGFYAALGQKQAPKVQEFHRQIPDFFEKIPRATSTLESMQTLPTFQRSIMRYSKSKRILAEDWWREIPGIEDFQKALEKGGFKIMPADARFHHMMKNTEIREMMIDPNYSKASH